MSNILPKDSSKVSYTLKITVSKQFDNFAKRALRVTETGTSRILTCLYPPSTIPFYASVSKGAASTIFYTFGMVRLRDSNPRPPVP